MHIDPRLNEIDDCLYRVAIRILIVQDDKVLLVQEASEVWWAFPGGGVEYGETFKAALYRELEEELGVPATKVSSDFQIVYHSIGNVVNGIPRMNLYYRVSIPETSLQKTSHVASWAWFTKSEFLQIGMHPSFNKTALSKILFEG